MLKAITILLAACALPISAGAAANPFDGTWKFNQEKSDLKGQIFTIQSVGSNKFRFTFGTTQDFTLVADGTDQVAIPGVTWALTIKDPNTWLQVAKTNGKKVGSATWTLAPDGKSHVWKLTGLRPDGSQFENSVTATRVSGSGGFTGTWRMEEMKQSKVSLLKIATSPTGKLVVSWPSDQQDMTMTLDGKDFPVNGPMVPKGATASATSAGANAIQVIDKLGGKVMDTVEWKVSADGKVLTITEHDPGQKKAIVAVWEKQ